VRTVLLLLFAAAALYVGACLFAYFFQGRLLYHPDRHVAADPRDMGLVFEELWLTTDDSVRIHGWYVAAQPTRGAVLFCHGNAGDVADRLGAASVFVEMGLSVLLFDYRGYGKSEGSPEEDGLYLDASAAWKELVDARGYDPERIVFWGESLGGGVAIELATRRKSAAVVCESTFTSIVDIGSDVYPWLPVRWLARQRFDNAAKAGAIGRPFLVIHSPQDEIVPYEHALALLEAAPGARHLATGGGHNDGGFLQREAWRDEVREFLLAALE